MCHVCSSSAEVTGIGGVMYVTLQQMSWVLGVSCMWLSSRCLQNRVSHCDSLTQIKGVLAAVTELGPAFSQCTHLCLWEKQG